MPCSRGGQSWVVTVGIVSAACGSASDPERNSLANPEHVASWANSASAVGVFTRGYEAIAFDDGELTFADDSCPATRRVQGSTSITGGCENDEGKTWSGEAVIETLDGERKLARFEDYGSADDPELLARLNGTIEIEQIGDAEHRLTFELIQEGGLKTTIDYTLEVMGDYDARTVWSGEGTVEREGLVAPVGQVAARTVEQTLDNTVCRGQSISGKTILTDAQHEAVVTYDGETDCDEDNDARWQVDGVDQGKLTGIVCSLGRTSGGQSPLLLLGALALFARRRSRR